MQVRVINNKQWNIRTSSSPYKLQTINLNNVVILSICVFVEHVCALNMSDSVTCLGKLYVTTAQLETVFEKGDEYIFRKLRTCLLGNATCTTMLLSNLRKTIG